MKHIRKFSILLALCLVLALLPGTSANAAEGGSLWLRHLPKQGGVTLAVCADTPIASGVITITYDSNLLAFQELTVESAYVAAHAVNDQEAGVIKISWIGTDAAVEGGYTLLRLRFEGPADQSAVMTGKVYDAAGNTVEISTLNLTGITAAIMQAPVGNGDAYTAESYAALCEQLENAEILEAMEAVTQAQLDEAAAKLNAAFENLELYVPEPPVTEPTEPAPTDPQPTQPVTNPVSTPTEPQSSTQVPTVAPKQEDNGWMLIALAAVLVAAVVAAVVILKKRRRK